MLTQQMISDKAYEIIDIPDLLSLLDLKEALVSIEAIGCQKEIAKVNIEAKADYLLGLKENQPNLMVYGDMILWLNTEVKALPIKETIEKNHGRNVIRGYMLSEKMIGLIRSHSGKGYQL